MLSLRVDGWGFFFWIACSAGPYRHGCHLLRGGIAQFQAGTIGLENPLFIHLSLCNAAPAAFARLILQHVHLIGFALFGITRSNLQASFLFLWGFEVPLHMANLRN